MSAARRALAVVLLLAILSAIVVFSFRLRISIFSGHKQPVHYGISTFVHISDLHVNIHFGADIVSDLCTLADELAATVLPSALVITGDLVDAKLRSKRSNQYEEEWAAYQQLWQSLAGSLGISAQNILDVRGNHDVFDAVRGGQRDYFRYYSAASHGYEPAGAPKGCAGRTQAHTAAAQCHGARNVSENVGPGARARVHWVHPQIGGPAHCPSLLLLGLELSPVVGMPLAH